MKIQRNSTSPADTHEMAQQVARCAQPRDVLALEGDLGAGKTCFVRGLVEGLGGEASLVSSPTFIIAQEYELPHDLLFIHIDAYRLGDDPQELATIGWDDMLERDDAIIAIEWPERLAAELPAFRTIYIDIAHLDQSQRTLTFDVPAHMAERFDVLHPASRECRTCGRRCTSDDPFFPFCSERCRYADLGGWFEEKFKISRAIESDDEMTD